MTDKIGKATSPGSFIDRERIFENGVALGYRILSIVLSLIFFSAYSKGIFILFMGSEGFFSYDLLTSGAIGIEVFFFTTELILLFFAVAVLGAFIPVLKYLLCREFTSTDAAMLAGLLVVNGFVWIGLGPVLARVRGDDINTWLVLFGLTLVICFHLAILFYRPPKDGLRSLLAVLLILLGLTAVAHKEMVTLLQFGLKHFGVGGEIAVILNARTSGGDQDLRGRLMFLSPDHAYVVLNGESELSIIPRSSIDTIKVPSKNHSSK
ncbi:hypothetical protein ACLIKD_06890 [Azonexus sp. IMCC34842]|uniref:hypothetical protein n=1 Tax=Azonexus sp. IMCC34842 TaxID=3420950 RepID=UPI003D0B4B5F